MAVHDHCMLALLLILIHIMPVAESSKMITRFVGYNVTLPCSYNTWYYGRLPVCWGRGKIPQFGCHNEIIATDGFKVTQRKSPRYQLSADLKQGDVSLTIISAKMGDSGIYGCRVEIPGSFNDLKIQVTLTIKNIRKSTVAPTDAARPVTQTANSLTPGYYGNYSTGSSTANTSQVSDHVDRSVLIIAAVILLLLLLLVLVTGLWLRKRKQQREVRTLAAVEHQADVSVHYGNMGAHIGFHTRGTAIENIYEQRDFGDYESCP